MVVMYEKPLSPLFSICVCVYEGEGGANGYKWLVLIHRNKDEILVKVSHGGFYIIYITDSVQNNQRSKT